MKQRFGSPRWVVSALCTALLLAGATATSCMAQGDKSGPIGNIDRSKMGAYRALAQLTYQAFQKGDYPLASELVRILERTWEQGEGSDGPKSLAKFNGHAFDQADNAMDAFIHPIMHYERKVPDAASVEAAYKNFLEKLTEADSAPPIPVPQVIHLSPEVLRSFVGKYQLGEPLIPIEITADDTGLWLVKMGEDKHRLLPFSSTEFFAEEEPSVSVSFTKNEHGQITGLTITGKGPVPMKATKVP